MRLVSVVFFAMIPVIFVSCGIARSTSSIWKAEDQREKSLGKIATAFEKADIVETDEFGRRSLAKKAADEVKPLEKRKAAYYFFKGDAYLSKAYDFRSKSIYDSSDFLATKALEYFNEAEKIAGGAKPEPAPAAVIPAPAPTPATEVKPEPVPAAVTPAPAPTPAPEVKLEPEPQPEPQPAVTADPEEKPSLKGDPFAEKKEEPKKAEPAKKEEKKPSYYDVYEEMRQKYLKKQSDEKEKEKEEEKKEEQKKEKKKEDSTAPKGGAK